MSGYLDKADKVRIDVMLGGMRASIQQSVSKMFAEREEAFMQLLDKAISEYDWEASVKREIEVALKAQVQSFVGNSMRRIERNFEAYKAIQEEADNLVRVRVMELYLKETQS